MPLWYVYSERVGVAIRLFSLAEEQLSTFMEGRCPRPSPLVGRLPMNAHVATRSTVKRNRSACSSRTGGWMGTLYWSRYGRLREHRTDRMVPGLRPGDGNRNLRCAVLTPQALRVDGPARGVPSAVNPLSRARHKPPPPPPPPLHLGEQQSASTFHRSIHCHTLSPGRRSSSALL